MKKITLLALALVLALGTMGVGYALWSETIYIQGTVNTGTLDADWSIETYYDDEIDGKDVSSVYAYISGNTLYVEVTGAYPCINYYVFFDVYNDGTIPFHVCQMVCTGPGQFPGTCTITQPTPIQVHPGDHAYGTIVIHLDNAYDPQELTRYTFSCDLTAVQYNEACPD